MEPVTMALMATQGMDALGGYMSARADANQLELSASGDESQAMMIGSYADFEAQLSQRKGDRFIASQIASYAKAGVKFEGSPARVFADTAKNISMDIALTRLNAANQQISLGFSALNKKVQAGFAKTKAISELGNGLLKMGATYAMSGSGAKTAGSAKSVKGYNTDVGVRDAGRFTMKAGYGASGANLVGTPSSAFRMGGF
jgi:hypothetical protein